MVEVAIPEARQTEIAGEFAAVESAVDSAGLLLHSFAATSSAFV